MPENQDIVRIVVIDDDSFMLRLMSRMLERLGYTHVVACDCGQQGLQQIVNQKAPVDLIFLDINMPGMDGVEFIRRLVECRYKGSVVLVSGENSRILESVDRLLEVSQLRSLGHLQKPVRPEELASILSQLKPNAGGDSSTGRWAKPVYAVQQLRAAMANGELVNYYQPKVSLTTHEVVGVESLVRWQAPNGPLIFPDNFIPLAEEHGLIGEITQLVLASAMKQAKLWQQAGRHLSVAVNVSMIDLASLDFPDAAAALAHSAGIEPGAITLEVTEGRVMRNLSTVLDVLSRLKLKRFRLAIDDFGTGHSSLAQLRDLPFDELKIDRGFVHNSSANPTLRAICSASLHMAQQLKLQVVAEGIEQRRDWELLRDFGCEVGQGYLVARPMPATQVLPWMTAWDAQHATDVPLKA
jgi:EAL domain-containing protein (putative c-di-GMP-specific phosphodiesterase class I)/ActR/RegA family two-component response regulator